MQIDDGILTAHEAIEKPFIRSPKASQKRKILPLLLGVFVMLGDRLNLKADFLNRNSYFLKRHIKLVKNYY